MCPGWWAGSNHWTMSLKMSISLEQIQLFQFCEEGDIVERYAFQGKKESQPTNFLNRFTFSEIKNIPATQDCWTNFLPHNFVKTLRNAIFVLQPSSLGSSASLCKKTQRFIQLGRIYKQNCSNGPVAHWHFCYRLCQLAAILKLQVNLKTNLMAHQLSATNQIGLCNLS